MGYFNLFNSPPIVAQGSYLPAESGYAHPDYHGPEDPANELDFWLGMNQANANRPAVQQQYDAENFVPPQQGGPLQGGATSQPGILSDPNNLNNLADAYGYGTAQMRPAMEATQRQYRQDDRSDFWDSLAGNVLHPLTGAIPGHLDDAMAASKFTLTQLEQKRDARRGRAREHQQFLTGLSDILKKSDPEDRDFMLQNMQQQRLMKDSESKNKTREARLEISKKQLADAQSKTKFYQDLATRKENRMDQAELNDLAMHKDDMLMKARRYEQLADQAEADGDLDKLKYFQSVADDMMQEYRFVRQLDAQARTKAEEMAERERIEGAKLDPKGKPESTIKPRSADEIYQGLRGTAGVLAPTQGAAVDLSQGPPPGAVNVQYFGDRKQAFDWTDPVTGARHHYLGEPASAAVVGATATGKQALKNGVLQGGLAGHGGREAWSKHTMIPAEPGNVSGVPALKSQRNLIREALAAARKGKK